MENHLVSIHVFAGAFSKDYLVSTQIVFGRIDNFKREPKEVQHVIDLMQEKIEGLLNEESIVNQYRKWDQIQGSSNVVKKDKQDKIRAKNGVESEGKHEEHLVDVEKHM
ncbi:ditrans,polycis-polyprenyl diphosphate synthase [(2E,6E)-farnesyl] [Sarracenia purpurea var. burkii]